ncbi:MAG TPA: hemerythrin domain-containing protein [Steroidobacteraceae bacterium]|jgi:hypothetical protein
MRGTIRYREQHAPIIRLARDLERHLIGDELAKDASAARQLLSLLSGKLFVHLAVEDRLLYPGILHCEDPAVRAASQRFLQEMGPISQAFKSDSIRWGTQGAIQSRPDAFVAETKQILAAVEERIRRENRALYPLFEKLSP